MLSHALEGQRHDHFIDLAEKGDIDLVFFGTTATEMWWWPNRGRAAWDQAFGSLKAANFGSQGSHFESLVWRMRNGELDGYRAKLCVLQFGPGDSSIADPSAPERHAEFVAGYASVIAEIRARQPQAKILLLAGFPRGQLSREPWRAIADMNAAVFAELADDETVFYADIGERFFLPTAPSTAKCGRCPDRPVSGPRCRSTRCGRKSFSPGSIGSFADEPRTQASSKRRASKLCMSRRPSAIRYTITWRSTIR